MAFRIAALTLLAAAASLAQPRLVIEGGKSLHIGDLHTSSPAVREIRLFNEGTDTLRITDVSGSCGCTGTLLSASSIPPGGNAVLKITFDPSKFRGRVEKTVSMKTNDPSDPDPHIALTADVTLILDIDAGHLTFSTLVDSVMTVDVAMRNTSERTFRITGAKSSSDQLGVRVSRELLEPGGEAALRCTLKQAKAGILRGTISITTDHPLIPSVVVPFFSYAKSAPPGSPGSSSR